MPHNYRDKQMAGYICLHLQDRSRVFILAHQFKTVQLLITSTLRCKKFPNQSQLWHLSSALISDSSIHLDLFIITPYLNLNFGYAKFSENKRMAACLTSEVVSVPDTCGLTT